MGNHHHHNTSNNIGVAFILNVSFTIFELIAGIYVNSVAIIADAVHDLGDSLALGSAWFLEKKSQEKANDTFTFGYRRLSILSAFLNCIILIIGAIYVIVESVKRLLNPEVVNAEGMIYVALVGLAVNGYAAWKVSEGSSMNEKTISWHLMEDVLGWSVVLIGAIVMLFYPIYWLDAVLSIMVSTFIGYKVVGRFQEGFQILAQGVPAEIDVLDSIKNDIRAVKGVESMHHTHLWALDDEKLIFSTHIVVDKTVNNPLDTIHTILEPYAFTCSTVQVEDESFSCTSS